MRGRRGLLACAQFVNWGAEMVDDIITLLFLILLQAVLGFDNLLYISLESKRAPIEDQARVRKLGITIAVGARLVLLFVLLKLIEYVQDPIFGFESEYFAGHFNIHSLIVLGGGAFIMYTAVKETVSIPYGSWAVP